MSLSDYSITSPEILLKYRANSKGSAIDDFPVPKKIVISMKSILGRLVEMTSASPVRWPYSDLHVGVVKHEKVGFVPLTFGASHTAFLVELLVACGAKTILLATGLGAFQPYMEPGDFVVPSRIVIGEGTSKYYMPNKRVVKTDSGIVKILRKACQKMGVKSYVGPIWNTDAMFREMRSKVVKLQGQGVLGVEMESSAMCTVAKFRGIRAASLLTVTDSLANLEWKPYFSDEKYVNAKEIMPRIIVESLELLLRTKGSGCGEC
jgi:uridine phosphorylase